MFHQKKYFLELIFCYFFIKISNNLNYNFILFLSSFLNDINILFLKSLIYLLFYFSINFYEIVTLF